MKNIVVVYKVNSNKKERKKERKKKLTTTLTKQKQTDKQTNETQHAFLRPEGTENRLEE